MTPAAAAAGPVLVLGASGKTGRAVTRALAARGVRVRAAVRPGRPTAAVLTAGAHEAVAVDLGTGHGLAEASTRRGGRLPPGAQRAPRRGRHGRAGLRRGRAGGGGAPGVPLRAAPRRRLDAAPRAQGPGRGRRPRHPPALDGAASRGLPPEPARRRAPGPHRGAARPRRAVHQRRPRRRRRGRGPGADRGPPRRRHPRARRARDAQRARPGRGRHRRARPPGPRRAGHARGLGHRARCGAPGPGPGRPRRDVRGPTTRPVSSAGPTS